MLTFRLRLFFIYFELRSLAGIDLLVLLMSDKNIMSRSNSPINPTASSCFFQIIFKMNVKRPTGLSFIILYCSRRCLLLSSILPSTPLKPTFLFITLKHLFTIYRFHFFTRVVSVLNILPLYKLKSNQGTYTKSTISIKKQRFLPLI